MGNNQNDPRQDEEHARALKSMAGRIDNDTPPIEEAPLEPTPAEVTPPKEEEPAPVVKEEPKAEDKPLVQEPKKEERPATYIPMPKYLAEKDEWQKTQAELAEANRKIEELTILANQKDGVQKDDDIEAYMAETGFDRETVDGLLKLIEKRVNKGEVMTPEEREAVTTATELVKEANIEAAFNVEFKDVGVPTIEKMFPNATPEQIEKAKDELDEIAHTKGNHDKSLDYLIFKNQDKLKDIFTVEPDAPEPQTKRAMETSRIGSGKPSNFSASDFKDGKTDFAVLGELDPSVRSQIIKDMDTKTYTSFIQFAKKESEGIQVMRDGRKITLK